MRQMLDVLDGGVLHDADQEAHRHLVARCLQDDKAGLRLLPDTTDLCRSVERQHTGLAEQGWEYDAV